MSLPPPRRLVILVLSVFLALGSGADELFSELRSNRPERVTIMLHWLPQAQFAGYLVAQDQGIFAKHNLEVTLLYKAPDVLLEEIIHQKAADFHTNYLQNALQISERGDELINVFQVSRHSEMAFIIHRDSGIEHLQDLNDKKVGIWTAEVGEIQRIFLNFHQVSANLVEFGNGIEIFVRRAVDAIVVMMYNEYYSILGAGLNADELTVFRFRDYGMDFPDDGMYCRRDFYEKNRALCRRVAAAVHEGWVAAFTDRQAALESIRKFMQKEHLSYSAALQRWMLNAFAENFSDTETAAGGRLDRDGFQRTVDFLLRDGKLENAPVYERFAPQVLPEGASPATAVTGEGRWAPYREEKKKKGSN